MAHQPTGTGHRSLRRRRLESGNSSVQPAATNRVQQVADTAPAPSGVAEGKPLASIPPATAAALMDVIADCVEAQAIRESAVGRLVAMALGLDLRLDDAASPPREAPSRLRDSGDKRLAIDATGASDDADRPLALGDRSEPDEDVLTIADIAALWRSELTFARTLVRRPDFPAPLPYRRGRWLRDEVIEFRKHGPRTTIHEPGVADAKPTRGPRGRITRSTERQDAA